MGEVAKDTLKTKMLAAFDALDERDPYADLYDLADAALAALGLDSPYFIGIAYDNPDSDAEVIINGEPYVPLRRWQERPS